MSEAIDSGIDSKTRSSKVRTTESFLSYHPASGGKQEFGEKPTQALTTAYRVATTVHRKAEAL
jgi:hypothetical protein